MKKLKNTRFGEIDYKDEDIIVFENGIPGFEDEKEFIIIPMEKDGQLSVLQSIKTPVLSFIIANPFVFFHDYEFEIDEQTKAELSIEKIENVTVWGILTISEDFQKSTINLKAPLIINLKSKKGKQLILDRQNYLTKTPLFPHLNKEGGK
ncbi:hypothetical protein BHF71_08755 [Vulcanibacillus modesticaldus]|uniref:Flagellar assembly factor FliW n=1 Tax=Vulcanibacillus modesticaldus TaxID=337097 RepID=A0A1D2YUX5_9BACI|nr:flagellar assembly protein FliW [Vulcanibacillus modesticaldus]OEF99499.1 hypothetical protein BHF71_08755 [Vulcanibacillus modesticaldus]